MRRMRSFLATVLAGAALVAAGCGGSSPSSTAGDVPDTASLAPQDAGLWITVDTDRSSDQWQALDAVLAQIPGAEALFDQALAQIGSTDKKLDFRRDIQPALGKEVIVVVPSGSSDPVLLAKPADDAKFKALLQDSTPPPVSGDVQGWTVVAQTQKALTAYQTALAKGALADSDAFAQAMDGLPEQALARVFVDGKGLGAAFSKAAGSASGALKNIPIPGVGNLPETQSGGVNRKALAQLGTIGLAVSAGDHVLRVDGSVETASGAQVVSFKPTLLERVPGDAITAIAFEGNAALTKQVRDSLATAGAAGALKSFETQLGVSLDDVLGLAAGQGVLYLRPALIIPELTVVLEPKDPAKALQTIDTVVAKLVAKTGAKISETSEGGVALKKVSVSILSVAWGRDGDRIVVTTGTRTIEDFDGGGPKLVASDRFKKAAAGVGFGDMTGGFAYVDVKGLAPLLNTIASAAGSGSGSGSDATLKQLTDTLSAIDSVAVNSSADGNRVSFQGAVRVG
jgi:hypothetical protein